MSKQGWESVGRKRGITGYTPISDNGIKDAIADSHGKSIMVGSMWERVMRLIARVEQEQDRVEITATNADHDVSESKRALDDYNALLVRTLPLLRDKRNDADHRRAHYITGTQNKVKWDNIVAELDVLIEDIKVFTERMLIPMGAMGCFDTLLSTEVETDDGIDIDLMRDEQAND